MKYFGTDGIRGNTQTKLTPELVQNIGIAAGVIFNKYKIKQVCIGYDTRISSKYIYQIISGNLNAMGINVINLGEVSTPVISYTIINNETIDSGIMISASHNPYYDNGIKFFGEDGKKISEKIEQEIDENIDNESVEINLQNIGNLKTNKNYVADYINYLVDNGIDLNGVKIALDTSNGSATKIAPEIFQRLNAQISIIANQPDGYNINENVGSTHLETIQAYMKGKDFDYGFAYDGDADRIILLDSEGIILDGDYIIYILAKYIQKENKLINNSVVSTVMTNLGFKKAIKKLNITNEETFVGDKHVMRKLDEEQLNLGGEQSGHIIISDLLPTGDGILTSVILAKYIKKYHINLKEIQKELIKLPQKLTNLKVADKDNIMNNVELKEAIKKIESNWLEKGRILVRPSGTENLIRIMVEHEDEDEITIITKKLVEFIKKI